jgi:hypothetical protein
MVIKGRSQNGRCVDANNDPAVRKSNVALHFMTTLVDSGNVPQKIFPFNNFHEPNRQCMLKQSVASRMLGFITIDQTNCGDNCRSLLSFIFINRD